MGYCNRLTAADTPWPRVMMSCHDHRVSVFIMIGNITLIRPFEEGITCTHFFICTMKQHFIYDYNVNIACACL